MQSPSLFSLVREDLQSHGNDWTRPGFQALAVYRLGHWKQSLKSRALRGALKPLTNTLHVLTRNFYGIELPFSATIGRRVVFEHQGGIVLHGNVKIGNNCIVRQNTTFGIKNLSNLHEAPMIGNNVNIGCGSVLLGNIKVGDNVTIGANSVVVRDIESNVTVAGIPTKIICQSIKI